MSTIIDLKGQLEKTIQALELKCQSSREPEVDTYLEKYKDVLKIIESGGSKEDVTKRAKTLLNCARGYMETSSDYQQDFLNEMGKAEKIVKNL